MLPPLGAALPPFSKTRSISAIYKPFSTKFSGIIPLTRIKKVIEKNLKYFTPSGGSPSPPHITKSLISLALMNEYQLNF